MSKKRNIHAIRIHRASWQCHSVILLPGVAKRVGTMLVAEHAALPAGKKEEAACCIPGSAHVHLLRFNTKGLLACTPVLLKRVVPLVDLAMHLGTQPEVVLLDTPSLNGCSDATPAHAKQGRQVIGHTVNYVACVQGRCTLPIGQRPIIWCKWPSPGCTALTCWRPPPLPPSSPSWTAACGRCCQRQSLCASPSPLQLPVNARWRGRVEAPQAHTRASGERQRSPHTPQHTSKPNKPPPLFWQCI